MNRTIINEIAINAISEYCAMNGIELASPIDKDTPLIGSSRILDSMGLVNIIVDIETGFSTYSCS